MCSVPFMRVPSNPLPSSNPLVAGRLSIALASSASSLSNTGAPRPRGTPRQTQVTTPPQESPRVRTSSMAAIMRSAVLGWGHLTMLASTSSRVNPSRSMFSGARSTSRTLLTNASTCVPATWARIFFAMAPAATRPMVSRALERPPPCVLVALSVGCGESPNALQRNAPRWPARRTSCRTWRPRGWVGRPPGGERHMLSEVHKVQPRKCASHAPTSRCSLHSAGPCCAPAPRWASPAFGRPASGLRKDEDESEHTLVPCAPLLAFATRLIGSRTCPPRCVAS